ncbi:MAG: Flp pilus assembly protein CpaB [Gammaproteobacteria bacterium]|nr:Flp pilus assembly protein CpaB [Gammaproteobacteria bacterium]
MRKGRVFLLLSVALMLSAGAAWVANKWILQRTMPAAEASMGTTVVAAALKIPFGQKIELAHIKIVPMPDNLIPDGAFHDVSKVEGRIAKQELLPGEIILEGRVAQTHGGSTLAAVLDPKMRAITLRVNDVIGVAGFLAPSNRVDILATRRNGKNRPVTQTLLKNIKVLAVDQTANPGKNEPVIVRAVTMEMSPRQSEALVNARSEGSIQLTLRNPLADSKVAPKSQTNKKKIQNKKKHTSHPPGTVTIIRGTKVNKTKVKI